MLARGAALFIGLFTLVNVFGVWRSAGASDFNVWWLAPPASWGHATSTVAFAVAGLVLVLFAVLPASGGLWRLLIGGVALACAAVALFNAVQFYAVWRDGLIRPAVPVPLSAVLCVVLALVAVAALRAPARPRRRRLALVGVIVTAAVCAGLFPLGQILFFGTTDYRQPATVAVVFGAQVHANGAPSTSLSDRMATAIGLYRRHLVQYLLVSGGVGRSGYDEAKVMAAVARRAGVPERAIIVDSAGLNTDATVRNSLPWLRRLAGEARVIVVSQFYHLPRIKLAYQRAGVEVLTVPAKGSAPISQTPLLVAREVPAFWVYYLRAVAR